MKRMGAACIAACFAVACGARVSDGSGSTNASSGGTLAGGGSSVAGTNATGDASIAHRNVVAACYPAAVDPSVLDSAGACAGWSVESEGFPVDLIFLVDRSARMAQPLGSSSSRWQAVRDGVANFLAGNAFVPATIRFFESPLGLDVCDANSYVVDSGSLSPAMPGNTGIVSALDATSPAGARRPAATALAGALQIASNFKASATAQPVQPAVVLITAGLPNGCGNDVAALEAAAQAGYKAGYSTYVVQLGADFDLNSVANASATAPVFLIDEGDAATKVSDALHQIVNPPLGFIPAVPQSTDPAHPIDPSRTIVIAEYFSVTGTFTTGLVPHLSSESECASSTQGGWYYDTAQTKMQLCECTQAIGFVNWRAQFFCS